jgi:hypothetical protein
MGPRRPLGPHPRRCRTLSDVAARQGATFTPLGPSLQSVLRFSAELLLSTYVIQLHLPQDRREVFMVFEAESDLQAIDMMRSIVPADRPAELWQGDRQVWTNLMH